MKKVFSKVIVLTIVFSMFLTFPSSTYAAEMEADVLLTSDENVTIMPLFDVINFEDLYLRNGELGYWANWDGKGYFLNKGMNYTFSVYCIDEDGYILYNIPFEIAVYQWRNGEWGRVHSNTGYGIVDLNLFNGNTPASDYFALGVRNLGLSTKKFMGFMWSDDL